MVYVSLSSEHDADDIKDKSSASQIAEVQAWLNSVFEAAGKEIPEFKYTTSAVAHLNNVARVSQARTHAAQLITTDLQEKAAEYHSQASRVREILDGVGLAFEDLSQNAMASTKVIGTVANSLNLKDTEMSSFLVGMGDLLLRKIDAEEKRDKAHKESKELLENIRKAIKHLTHLKRTVTELEEEASHREGIIQQRQHNLKIMASKQNQYVIQLANIKTALNKVGYTPEINHGALIQMIENQKELESKTEPILNILQTYQNLPPDKYLAELAIEEKRYECEAAERSLEDAVQKALNTLSE
ncbi:AUGMIN subunit 1 isoform X2 [Cryptomeria japonica]|uniref:AUGMIN subunit 1 isoform X2 n=1 Tax=Cryptomeria japonica TaxID=3369 RepID=UPI0025ABF022|nr:AUGMIN subunit 1 isoform X2 [Cryptomeria japonica]